MILKSLLKRLTNTNAIKQASGQLEICFFEPVYRLLYFTGLSDSEQGIPYLIYSTTVKTSLVLLVLSEIWQMFSISWNIDVATNSFNILVIQFGAFFRYKTTTRNKDVFKNLATSMESKNFDLSTSERKQIMEVWRNRNEASLKLLLFLGNSTLVAWMIYPLVDDLEYNLPLNVRLPVDYQTPTRYPFAYAVHLVLFIYMSFFVMTTDLTMQSYAMHLLCQFDVLKDCFKNILTDCQLLLKDEVMDLKNLHLNQKFRQEYIKRLGNMVDQHVFILNNTLRLRDVMSAPMLTQLVCSTVLICTLAFQVATSVTGNLTRWFMSVFFLGYNMLVQYVVCRWCEEIKFQSEGVADAVYSSGWEDGIITVPGVRMSIMLILARAKIPVQLSAGGMYNLSLEAYATMMKTSYSALTVLLNLR